MHKIIFTLFLFMALFLTQNRAFAAEACVPGEHNPNPASYSDETSEADCPAETICYVSLGSSSRCYVPEGTPIAPIDPAAGFSTAASSDTCTALESINFNPNPVEAKKDLIVQGKIENCPDIAVDAIFLDLENLEDGTKRNGVRSVKTKADSTFNIDKFSIDIPGRWKFKFRYNLKDRIITSDAAVVQVVESTKKEYTCGDTVTDQSSICPADCPATPVGNIIKCGPSTSNEVLEDLCKAMGDVKVDVANLPSCYKLSEKIDARKCSNDEASYICADPALIMCREDNGSVGCGVKQIDPANAGGVPCDPETGRIVEQPPTKAQIARDVGLDYGSIAWKSATRGGLNLITGSGAIAGSIAEEERSRVAEVIRRYNEQVNSLPKGVMTAIGCIPTEPKPLVEGLLKYGSMAAGSIAFLIMVLAALHMITAEGNPESIKAAQEKFYSAIIGLLLIIFAVLLMQIIGVDILGLPEFGPVK